MLMSNMVRVDALIKLQEYVSDSLWIKQKGVGLKIIMSDWSHSWVIKYVRIDCLHGCGVDWVAEC